MLAFATGMCPFEKGYESNIPGQQRSKAKLSVAQPNTPYSNFPEVTLKFHSTNLSWSQRSNVTLIISLNAYKYRRILPLSLRQPLAEGDRACCSCPNRCLPDRYELVLYPCCRSQCREHSFLCPEAGSIRGEDFIDQDHLTVHDAKLEFAVCQDDAALIAVITSEFIEPQAFLLKLNGKGISDKLFHTLHRNVLVMTNIIFGSRCEDGHFKLGILRRPSGSLIPFTSPVVSYCLQPPPVIYPRTTHSISMRSALRVTMMRF